MKKLNEIPGNNPFKVPENYFKEVNRKIILTTSGYDEVVNRTGILRTIRPYLAIAASVAGLILLSYIGVIILTPSKMNTQVSEVILEEYPNSYLNDIDMYTLEKDAASIDFSEEMPDVSKNEIIDYLISENIEISDIYEQL